MDTESNYKPALSSQPAQVAAFEKLLTLHPQEQLGLHVAGLPKLVSPKSMAIGFALGLAFGVILALGEFGSRLIQVLHQTGFRMTNVSVYASIMTLTSLVGATIGMSRTRKAKRTKNALKPSPAADKEASNVLDFHQVIVKQTEVDSSIIGTMVYENLPEQMHTDTNLRDKVLAQARQALLNMDPSKVIHH